MCVWIEKGLYWKPITTPYSPVRPNALLLKSCQQERIMRDSDFLATVTAVAYIYCGHRQYDRFSFFGFE